MFTPRLSPKEINPCKICSFLATASVLVAAASAASAADGRDYISICWFLHRLPLQHRCGRAIPALPSSRPQSNHRHRRRHQTACAGAGVDTPDIANASRQIKKSEIETCAKNGVTQIVEVKVGYDGIVMANSKKAGQLKLTRKEIFLALAKEVPSPEGDKLVAIPNKTWKDVNSSLPATRSRCWVGLPPPVPATPLPETALDHGCTEFPLIKNMKSTDEKQFKAVCQTVREDGAYIEVGENDNLIVQKLEANPNSLGIFGFSFLIRMPTRSAFPHRQSGPTFETIADGSTVSRPLFIYVEEGSCRRHPWYCRVPGRVHQRARLG